jgi:hypothetical protein
VADYWMKVQGTMRLATMQIDGDCGDSDMREGESGKDITPPRQIEQPEIHEAIPQ